MFQVGKGESWTESLSAETLFEPRLSHTGGKIVRGDIHPSMDPSSYGMDDQVDHNGPHGHLHILVDSTSRGWT